MERRTVTILFCDLERSTALGESVDPEALRGLLARYFERMRSIIERHGGTVEKFIGDAVMAVFGVPMAHEDDALRAVRAAIEMRQALPELGVHARIGVNTGLVVTGTDERLATGDAVNVAARLEQAASTDNVLIGEPTLVLVRGVADVEATEPLNLRGKSERVRAYRLVRLREAQDRWYDMPFVGRDAELALLQAAWERITRERRCDLVTIMGEAGIGKSRLVARFTATLDATIVGSRCLPYGDGITYWPVIDVVKQLGAVPPDPTAASAIRSLLGENGTPVAAEDIAWAFRKLLEHAAAEGPLAVVFDDVQWGEETFLDLVDHVTLLSSEAPILLFCLARSELTERRPAWPIALRLEPLRSGEVQELIPQRIPAALRRTITRAAGGNPLFIHEMVAMAGGGDADVVVPPSLQALLAARLDLLDPPERAVLQCASVEGEVFHRGAIQALRPEEPQVTPHLASLVRRQLIRPERSELPGEDSFRFRHLLIRDAAYDALPKAVRAELHERFASWLQERGSTLVELDEIVAYHLEQACRYRAEIGLPVGRELRDAASHRLAAAGHRAYLRGDYRAAVRILERGAALADPGTIDLLLELTLVDALAEAGQAPEAAKRGDGLAERAAVSGDRVGELSARITGARIGVQFKPEGSVETLEALLEEGLPLVEAAGDDLALSVAYYALGVAANHRGRVDTTSRALERAIGHGSELGVSPVIWAWRDVGLVSGTTPAQDLLVWLDEQEARGSSNAYLRRDRALGLAMLGRFAEARQLLASVRAELADRGAEVQLAATMCIVDTDVELMAGNPQAAAEIGQKGCAMLDALEERGFQSSGAGYAAQALYALGRLGEADSWAGRAAELGADDDALTQMLWRQVRAKVLARRSEFTQAERLAREAISIGGETDLLNSRARADEDLAEVLALAGQRSEAVEAVERALAQYERKGNLAMRERARMRLAGLRAARGPSQELPG